jgi:serine/threonine protein kinase
MVRDDDGRMQAKIADLGSAVIKQTRRTRRSQTIRTGQAVGTESWLAPETLISSQHTSSSDIYSFGLILWRILNDGAELFQDWEEEDKRLISAEGVVRRLPLNPDMLRQLYDRALSGRPFKMMEPDWLKALNHLHPLKRLWGIMEACLVITCVRQGEDIFSSRLRPTGKVRPTAIQLVRMLDSFMVEFEQGFHCEEQLPVTESGIPGLRFVQVAKDGHCFYRSVARCLGIAEEESAILFLRNAVSEEIRENLENYRKFFNLPGRTLEEYTTAIVETNEWAGDLK